MKLQSPLSAVVTGGASGLGSSTAKALAAQGVKVAIFDLDEEKGCAVSKKIAGIYCKVNVASEHEVEDAFQRVRAAHGQERILVNCAGIGTSFKTAWRDRVTGEIRRFPMDVFNKILQVNLLGSFHCISHSAAGMLMLQALEAGGERGVIINTASVAAQDGQIGQAAYSASKGGIVGMTLPIARDLAEEGIRVNTILPGIFDTPLMMGASEKVKATLAASVPFPKRFGYPDEYASLVLEIVRNAYLNGETIRLDGAIRMAPR